jgi:hypothetical protein
MKFGTVVTTCCMALSICGLLLSVPGAASAQPCANGALSGNYGYSLTGYTLGSPQNKPIALGGTFVADGNGNLKIGGIANLGGSIRSQDGLGSYVVNADCSGHMTVNFAGFLPLTADFFLVSGGQRALVVQTNKTGVSSGEFDKQ